MKLSLFSDTVKPCWSELRATVNCALNTACNFICIAQNAKFASGGYTSQKYVKYTIYSAIRQGIRKKSQKSLNGPNML